MRVLVEPLVSGSPYAEVLRRAGSGDPDTVAVTVTAVYSCASTESAPGHARAVTVPRLVFDERGGIVHDGLSDETVARLEREVRMLASDVVTSAARIPDIVDVEGWVLIETLLPPVPLVVLGAGQDVLPVVGLARGLGRRTEVVDLQAREASRSRFAIADKVARLLRDSNLARLHSPVGLDIGAHIAAAIALSVVVEMRAVLDGRRGGMLRERRDSIHGGADDGAYVSSAERRLVPRAAA